jgi:hypothetical protein
MRNAPTKMSASRALYTLDRAMKERLLDRDFGTQHLRRALDYFSQAGVEGCIYCGNKLVERWDHLVPVSLGGGTIVGNMVPACQPCDDSKGGKDFRAWLAGKAEKNPARGKPDVYAAVVTRVEAYQRHFNYVVPADFRGALDAAQLEQYDVFLQLMSDFRSKLAQIGLLTLPLSGVEAEETGEAPAA